MNWNIGLGILGTGSPMGRNFAQMAQTAGGTAFAAMCLFYFLIGTTVSFANDASVREPVKSVDLSRYAGRWFEQGRYDAFFQAGCEAVTAEYRPLPDGTLKVTNTCRSGSPAGDVRSITGVAKVVEGTRNTKLKVSFFGPLFLGDYWILDRAADYSWAVVGEASGQYLWLLTRSRRISVQQYRAMVDRAVHFGYDASIVRKTTH
jgi:apolipoprotein D and lipocalin family protein